MLTQESLKNQYVSCKIAPCDSNESKNPNLYKNMAVEAKRFDVPAEIDADIIPFKLRTPDFQDLYDGSRQGTESFPQLGKVILLTMIEEESRKAQGNDRQFIRERATDRFLDFVLQNEALSLNLCIADLSDITKKSQEAISKLFSASKVFSKLAHGA